MSQLDQVASARPGYVAAAMELLHHFERCKACDWNVISGKIVGAQRGEPQRLVSYLPCPQALELKAAAQGPATEPPGRLLERARAATAALLEEAAELRKGDER